MDRGWRRSGTLIYLPDASRSCCPHYTIRLPASEFKPSRDQRQALHRWNRHVLGERYIKEAEKNFPKTKEEKKRSKDSFDLEHTLHESERINLKPGIEPDHRFEVTLEPDKFTEEKFELFDNYQRHVHHEQDEDVSASGFRRFLCSSPVSRQTDDDGKKLGSFHQCYRLDGRLIAMAVLDLLPHAVSGVYFIYHSDFEKWSFGKLSALREACLALEQEYQYYYMGYYIHSCKKMRYKGDYKQQYVLDYDSLQWDPLDDEMRHLMENSQYASMSRHRTTQNGGGSLPDEKDDVLHPTPTDAMSSGLSLLQLGMPGVLSLEQLRRRVELDNMKVHLGRGSVHRIQNISTWESGSDLDHSSLRGIFAELAAVLGPDVAKEAIIDFG
ncbi:hypothetical protein DOTSEDRAFT_143846 [Dothistroma septosporum NZE10]|uniref:Arginyl-tRNA--protein transferase 1 n=1 Tax=Dothistroma septosporum (strain NZE10 / CBS 128990) TaxID=675120 RepID=N1Q4E2_DOTSN|nr:hypothetical protein DOTSEDRAFT_143846 [Dothistroma septosporum NZE10]